MTDLIKQVGGLQKAKDIVNGAPDCSDYYADCSDYGYTYISKINNNSYIDENRDVVYGVGAVKFKVDLLQLRQAIADYNTDHCSDIINHVSPSTQVYDK